MIHTYEIWSEGYECGEERGGAICHGRIEASSFREACDKLAERNEEFRRNYDQEDMTYWRCRLFDNQEDARKYFG